MPSNKLKVIQIGLGGWGRDWYRTILTPFKQIGIVACVDAVEDARSLAVKEAGVPADRLYATLSDALKANEADAVVITASLPGHVPVALEAIKRGLHVLLEKPFAPSVAQARKVVDAAAAAGRIIMISQNYRYHPAPQAVADIVSNETLGKLGVVFLDFRRDSIVYNASRERHYNLTEPLLADMSIHHFDLMRMITGADAATIDCHSYNPPWSHFKEAPAATAVIEMANGVVVNYRGSWVSPGPVTPWAGLWRMEFEKGEVVWSSRGDKAEEDEYVVVRPYKGKEKRLKLKAVRYLDRAGTLAAFVDAISMGTEPATSGARNIGSIALTYAAIASAKKGRRVAL